MSIPLLDLGVLYTRQREAIQKALLDVAEHGAFIKGPEVGLFEDECAAWLGHGAHVIGVANGSDAIVLALLALGIGPGDEVVCPAFTFVSTATSVSLVGATPVFCDVDAATFNVTTASMMERVGPQTKAVIPVHLFGRPVDVPDLRRALDAAGRDDVRIIEDVAQAFGAWVRGQRVSTFGDAATLSFFPAKNLGAFGDAGGVVTPHEDVADRVRMLGQHGSRVKYENVEIGYNSRLDTIQAAVLRVRLPALDGWIDERRANAARYDAAFADLDPERVALPLGDDPSIELVHSFNQYTLRVADRDGLHAELREAGIGSAIYYPRTLAEQACFASLDPDPDAVPVSRDLCKQVLSIPIYPGLPADHQAAVIDAIRAHATR